MCSDAWFRLPSDHPARFWTRPTRGFAAVPAIFGFLAGLTAIAMLYVGCGETGGADQDGRSLPWP